MDVQQVLKSTLSTDTSVRTNAEEQLTRASDADFSGYLRTLAQELANEQSEQSVRQAAGLILKNAFSSRELARLHEFQLRWVQQIDPESKKTIKDLAVKTLSSQDARAGTTAAQFVAAIAAAELPRNLWPELMPLLVENVSEGQVHQKQASLQTIGFICEMDQRDLQNSLSQYSNSILTAVVQGARKEEPSADVRNAAMAALCDSLDFVKTNFENEGERNYIMQVVCEATQAPDTRILQGAYGCLTRIMSLYYDKMSFYMEKALFGLTIQGMKHEEEDVAKLAVEFWCSVCEEEIAIEDENEAASMEQIDPRPYYNFAKIATQEVLPVLLELLTRQDEDASEDEYNLHRAAYQCLQLWAQAVRNPVVQPVLQFIEQNIRQTDWRLRDAAASAFGAIMEGPEPQILVNIVKQGLPILISMMQDTIANVRDSVAYTLGRVSELVPDAIDQSLHLEPLVSSLFTGLSSSPSVAASSCWALMNLADRFSGQSNSMENPMTPYFDNSVSALVNNTERMDGDSGVRIAAYEVLNTFITTAGSSSHQTIGSLSNVILQRLEQTVQLRQQVLGVEDRLRLDEMQTSLCTVIMTIIQKLESEIKPQADRTMQTLIHVLSTLNGKSSVADSVLAAIGSLATALETDFLPYMESFSPFLFRALASRDEPGLCSMAIGLVSDITRSLGSAMPYCDQFMNHLLENLKSSTTAAMNFKPAILECFGDLAQAITGNFEVYLQTVAQVLEQAAGVRIESDAPYEMLEYVNSLREGAVDAWAGIIVAMKVSNKAEVLKPYVGIIFRQLHIVTTDDARSEGLLRACMGVIGDLAETFPRGSLMEQYSEQWLTKMIKDTKAQKGFSSRTTGMARWAKQQAALQTGSVAHDVQPSTVASDLRFRSRHPFTKAFELYAGQLGSSEQGEAFRSYMLKQLLSREV